MGWLEDYLATAQQGRNALLTASKTGGTMAPEPGLNAPQGTGPTVAHEPDGMRLRLGTGVRRGNALSDKIDTPYDRIVRTGKGGGLLEGHDYGQGDVRWFRRKNPSALEAAARLAFLRQGGEGPAGVGAQQVQGMSPEDQERVRYLLGQ